MRILEQQPPIMEKTGELPPVSLPLRNIALSFLLQPLQNLFGQAVVNHLADHPKDCFRLIGRYGETLRVLDTHFILPPMTSGVHFLSLILFLKG